MTNKVRALLGAAACALAVTSVAGLALRGRGAPIDGSRSSRNTPNPGGSSDPARRAPYDPKAADQAVKFWAAQAERDPQAVLELRELAGAYLTRQRERGDIADAVKAEEAARGSLKVLSRRNAVAMTRLARSLLAQHRFPEALAEAKRASEIDPHAGRLVADILLELGDYDEAEAALSASPREPDDLNYFAVRARIEAINGKPDAALRLLREAKRVTDDRPDMPAETVAWYDGMIAHSLIDAGKLDEAESACREALAVFPADYRALTALAAIASWRGDWPAAIASGDAALKISPQNPEALKIVGDAHAASGHQTDAEVRYRDLKTLAHSFPRIYDRHWALFCADQGIDLDEALTVARRDLELRHDVHAYDTLAWVCFKKGMLPEAEAAMTRALARDTREATLLYHAGMIARASGDIPRARTHFTQARAINPYAIPLRWLRWMETKPAG